MTLLAQRVRSLNHRAGSLGDELDAWAAYTAEAGPLEKNASQLDAISVFLQRLQTRLADELSDLERVMAAQPPRPARALESAWAVDDRITRAHQVWGYFREKLAQRFVPRFSRSLLAADLIAHDCYRTVMDAAGRLGIRHTLGLRDYPLTFFQAEYASPVTWRRGVALPQLGYRSLPLPVVGIPWDHQGSPWEFPSLHHEVAHDIDADLGDLSSEIADVVADRLTQGDVPGERVAAWRRWTPELFADLVGILLAGPAFAAFLATAVAGPDDVV